LTDWDRYYAILVTPSENEEMSLSNDAVDVLMITYNRPAYTKMSLDALLRTAEEGMRLWIWHNGDDEETMKVVESYRGHPNVHRIHISQENQKLRVPTNWVFAEGEAPYIAKVDDDCLVSEGWLASLRTALKSSDKLGVAACWHFQTSDFDRSIAKKKIIQLNDEQWLMRNNWVQGSGIMLKRACVDKSGLIPDKYTAFTPYCRILSKDGWDQGWVIPLVLIEHMDDPRSEYCRFKTEADFQATPPLSASFADVRSLAEWKERMKWTARDVQGFPLGDGLASKLHLLYENVKDKLRRTLKLDPPWRKAVKRSRLGRP
jgi:glycosyltransferase involved in cell wall biosynthesis